MLRYSIGLLLIWLGLFLLRLWWEGGLKSDYQQDGLTIFQPLQQNLDSKIHSLMPEPSASLLSGMLLGVQGKVPFLLKKKLQATSTIHLLVVSGQNLSLVGSFCQKVLQSSGRINAAYMTAFFVVGYSLLTGFGIPVIRALIMALLTLGGQILGRPTTSWWILCLTGALMLLIEPQWLLSISFQLSFMATAGAVIVAERIEKLILFVPEFVRSDLAVSLAAQLLTLPIIAYNFQQISIVGVIVNILVLWIVSPVMILGSIGLLLGFGNDQVGQMMLLIPHLLLIYFVRVVEFFAQFGWSAIVVPLIPISFWFIYYIVLIMVHLKHDSKTTSGRRKQGFTAVGLGIN